MKHYLTTRGGKSTIRWDRERRLKARRRGVAASRSASTSTTCSETLTPSAKTSTFSTPNRRGTSRTTSRTTRGRPRAATDGTFRTLLGKESSTTSLRTWRRCFHSTCPGRMTGFTGPQNSTAELWLREGVTWWPRTLTAPEVSWVSKGPDPVLVQNYLRVFARSGSGLSKGVLPTWTLFAGTRQ